ncbi:MAG: hypothetical protein AAGD14_08165 [Planctomycetota bacterium]
MRPILLVLVAFSGAAGCATATKEAFPPPKEENRPAPNPFVDREPFPGEEARKVQFRPFYWKYEQGATKKVNILGIVYRWREDEVFERLNILPIVYYTARKQPQELKSWFLMIFPVVWVGSDDFLIFPFGGITRGLLGLHELIMITPLYIRTRTFSTDRSGPIVYTVRHFPWPFFAYGSDQRVGGRRKWRIWPFWGKEVRRRDGSSKGFIGWPFYTWWRKSDTDFRFLFFPFYGRDETAIIRSTTVMFPFYQRVRDFHSGLVDTTFWPFYRKAGGVDWVERERYWPFWDYRRADFTTTEVVAWPFWRRTYVDNERQFTRYTWVVPFYRDKVKVTRADGRISRKYYVWPLTRVEYMADGGTEVTVPELLPVDWPSLRESMESIKPFISIYHRRKYADERVDVSAAFSLYMHRRGRDFSRTSLLTGLVGWDRDETGKYVRLLWGIRFRVAKPS